MLSPDFLHAAIFEVYPVIADAKHDDVTQSAAWQPVKRMLPLTCPAALVAFGLERGIDFSRPTTR